MSTCTRVAAAEVETSDRHPEPAAAGPSVLAGPAGVVLGWTLLVVGVVLMPLPGPGSLVVLAGVRVLVPHHAWAARTYDAARSRIVRATAAGVSTWPRAVASALGPLWLGALTVAYAADLQVPSFSALGLEVGPGLPLRGLTTTTGLALSAVATAGLLVVALARWGPTRHPVTTGQDVPAAARSLHLADVAPAPDRVATRVEAVPVADEHPAARPACARLGARRGRRSCGRGADRSTRLGG